MKLNCTIEEAYEDLLHIWNVPRHEIIRLGFFAGVMWTLAELFASEDAGETKERGIDFVCQRVEAMEAEINVFKAEMATRSVLGKAMREQNGRAAGKGPTG